MQLVNLVDFCKDQQVENSADHIHLILCSVGYDQTFKTGEF